MLGSKCRLVPQSVAAAFFYMASKKHDAELVEQFILNVESGENLSAGSPRMELRRWLEGRRRDRQIPRVFFRSAYIALVRVFPFDVGAREGFYKTAIWSKINDVDLPEVV